MTATPLPIINKQPIEKADWCPEGSLEVFDIFPTIQGEGPFAGYPAVFLRLSGCNLQCKKCDTDYTSKRNRMSVLRVVSEIARVGYASPVVVITGGEPFRQRLTPLLDELMNSRRAHPHAVQIETNGTLSGVEEPLEHLNIFKMEDVTIVCSPKTPKLDEDFMHLMKYRTERQSYNAYWKYVAGANDLFKGSRAYDGLPVGVLGMELAPCRPPRGTSLSSIFLSPRDDGNPEDNAKNIAACVDSCMQFGYRLSLQTHKIIGVP